MTFRTGSKGRVKYEAKLRLEMRSSVVGFPLALLLTIFGGDGMQRKGVAQQAKHNHGFGVQGCRRIAAVRKDRQRGDLRRKRHRAAWHGSIGQQKLTFLAAAIELRL